MKDPNLFCMNSSNEFHIPTHFVKEKVGTAEAKHDSYQTMDFRW